MLNGELADYHASPLEAAMIMAELSDECQVWWKYVAPDEWIKKSAIGRYILENAGDFFEAFGLWAKVQKYGSPWGNWADAPAHIWDVMEAFDRVSAGIQAKRIADSDTSGKGKP